MAGDDPMGDDGRDEGRVIRLRDGHPVVRATVVLTVDPRSLADVARDATVMGDASSGVAAVDGAAVGGAAVGGATNVHGTADTRDVIRRFARGLEASVVLSHRDPAMAAVVGTIGPDDVDVRITVGDGDVDGGMGGSAGVREDAPRPHETSVTDGSRAAVGMVRSGRQTPDRDGRTILSLISCAPDAERFFRSAVVTLDAIPGNQVEGISALYHVSAVDGPDSMTTVVALSTHMTVRELAKAVRAIGSHEGTDGDIRIIDVTFPQDGFTSGSGTDSSSGTDASSVGAAAGGALRDADAGDGLADDSIRHSAVVLVPWLDMDVNATLDGDPVSYLLALSGDSDTVGMLADDWVFRDSSRDDGEVSP